MSYHVDVSLDSGPDNHSHYTEELMAIQTWLRGRPASNWRVLWFSRDGHLVTWRYYFDCAQTTLLFKLMWGGA